MKSLIVSWIAPAMAPPDANGPAGFTTQWHNHGAGHQGNNTPGDTAADRHNFGDAPAGGSVQNPTQGSAQDDFSPLDLGMSAYMPDTYWDMIG